MCDRDVNFLCILYNKIDTAKITKQILIFSNVLAQVLNWVAI